MSKATPIGNERAFGEFEALNVSKEAGVLIAEINATPMNLLGPELIRDLASFIQRRPIMPSRCSCSRPPTRSISFPTWM